MLVYSLHRSIPHPRYVCNKEDGIESTILFRSLFVYSNEKDASILSIREEEEEERVKANSLSGLNVQQG